MRRRPVAALLITAVVVSAMVGAPVSGAKSPKSACKNLPGKDLAPAPNAKIVVRGTDEGERLLGCVLRNPVRTLAIAEDGLDRDSFTLHASTGGFALVEEASNTQYGGGASAAIVNLRTGRVSKPIWSYGCALGERCPSNQPQRAVLASKGQLVAGYDYDTTPGSQGGVVIAAFSRRGNMAVLARAPRQELAIQSLEVRGTSACWVQSGAERCRALPGARAPQ